MDRSRVLRHLVPFIVAIVPAVFDEDEIGIDVGQLFCKELPSVRGGCSEFGAVVHARADDGFQLSDKSVFRKNIPLLLRLEYDALSDRIAYQRELIEQISDSYCLPAVYRFLLIKMYHFKNIFTRENL